jgi:hypothetical protein
MCTKTCRKLLESSDNALIGAWQRFNDRWVAELGPESINIGAFRIIAKKAGRFLWLVLWIWQASEVLEATARHAIYGVQWRRLDRKWLGLLKDRS